MTITRKRLDIDRAAVFLIKKYGDDSVKVAFCRANCCRCSGDTGAEAEWQIVVKRIAELHFAPPMGKLQ